MTEIWGIPSPYKSGAPKPPFWTTSQLNGNFNDNDIKGHRFWSNGNVISDFLLVHNGSPCRISHRFEDMYALVKAENRSFCSRLQFDTIAWDVSLWIPGCHLLHKQLKSLDYRCCIVSLVLDLCFINTFMYLSDKGSMIAASVGNAEIAGLDNGGRMCG